MKRLAFICTAVVCLALAATASAQFAAGRSSVLGTWNVDVAALIGAEGASPDELAMMASAMNMAVTVAADGSLTMSGSMMGETRSDSGTWAFVSAEGATVTMSAVDPEGQSLVIVWVFSDENNVVMTSKGMSHALVRAPVAAETQAAPEAATAEAQQQTTP